MFQNIVRHQRQGNIELNLLILPTKLDFYTDDM